MSSAVLVQADGWQRSFQPVDEGLNRVDQVFHGGELPRRIACRVMMPKKISTMLMHFTPTWGEVHRDPRVLRQPCLTWGCLVRAGGTFTPRLSQNRT
jgi:hypothetical protein